MGQGLPGCGLLTVVRSLYAPRPVSGLAFWPVRSVPTSLLESRSVA